MTVVLTFDKHTQMISLNYDYCYEMGVFFGLLAKNVILKLNKYVRIVFSYVDGASGFQIRNSTLEKHLVMKIYL